MKAYLVSDVRTFMRSLLSEDLFNDWQLRSAEIAVLSYITIDGKVNGDYLSDEEKEKRTVPYLLWQEIQPKIRNWIQGGKTPTMMNITLAMDPSKFRGMPEGAVESLLLNIRYEMLSGAELQTQTAEKKENGAARRLTLITGVSMKTFSMDKTPERLWDEAIPAFFKKHGMPLEEA